MRKKLKADEYRPEYAKQLVSWFKNAPLYHREMRTVYNKKSDKSEEICEKCRRRVRRWCGLPMRLTWLSVRWKNGGRSILSLPRRM